jgi:magnesium-transporting ATPase (P-type)
MPIRMAVWRVRHDASCGAKDASGAALSCELYRVKGHEKIFQEGFPMKTRARLLAGYCFLLSLVCLLLPVSALAQEGEGGAAGLAALGAFMFVFFLIALAFYVYMALALMTIAKKTNTENAWLAWIPILNIFLMLNIAKKPLWWFVLFLIPLVNIVIAIIVWMAIAEARHKPNWWGILMIVPFVNFIVPGYLAWSD